MARCPKGHEMYLTSPDYGRGSEWTCYSCNVYGQRFIRRDAKAREESEAARSVSRGYRKATTADLAAAGYVPAAALESANTRIAEYRASEAGWRERLRAAEGRIRELEGDLNQARNMSALDGWVASNDRRHLEEAADFLRKRGTSGGLWGPEHDWYTRDQALRAKPSPAGEKEPGRRYDICGYSGCGNTKLPFSSKCYDHQPQRSPAGPAPSPPPLADGHGPVEALRADMVLAIREACAQGKGMWFAADELERLGRNG